MFDVSCHLKDVASLGELRMLIVLECNESGKVPHGADEMPLKWPLLPSLASAV